MLRTRFLAVALLTMVAPLAAQPWQLVGRQSTPGPHASWIAVPGVAGDAFGVFHFRKQVVLDARPRRYVVHVSADQRYRLYVNGHQVSSGPQRSDVLHWRYETVDLAPYLVEGTNVVAALVWNWGPNKPIAQHTLRSGFVLWGADSSATAVNTGASWKAVVNEAYAPIPVRPNDVLGYYAAPPGERVDGRLMPWGWEQPSFDDTGWPQAVVVGPAIREGTEPYGNADSWALTPRTIPHMEESPTRFAAVRRPMNLDGAAAFLTGTRGLTFAPNSRTTILLDQAALTNAYVILNTSGGTGSTVRLTYAESLRDSAGNKGNRDEVVGKHIAGYSDVFRLDGGTARRYQTLWFRTYRYVQLEVETGDESLTINDLSGIFTAYPMQEKARFASDHPWLSDLWKINWRVARLCAFETYFDTPYYEQLQYAGDTRIQALLSLYMSGDDRLVRQAIAHFDLSRTPEGFTMSRYPSDPGQFIPPFSLIWVAMVHDYWMHRDDPAFVRELLPGVRSVLSYFERHMDTNGLLKPTPWWNFVDWSWPGGIPPGGNDGHSVVISFQYVYALDRAAELEAAFGREAEAARYRETADRIRRAARELAWNGDRGLFRDAPGLDVYSQQTNVMAVLVDALPAERQRPLVERILNDATLTQSTYYFTFYNFEAVHKVGLGDRYLDLLGPWKEMLDLGLTTTLEEPEPSRSDSHAWSAHPNYGLLATVLGIRPSSPGFKTVRIAPAPGKLRRVSGTLPHPAGNLTIELTRTEPDGIHARIEMPQGVTGTFEWNGKTIDLRPGTQDVRLQAAPGDR